MPNATSLGLLWMTIVRRCPARHLGALMGVTCPPSRAPTFPGEATEWILRRPPRLGVGFPNPTKHQKAFLSPSMEKLSPARPSPICFYLIFWAKANLTRPRLENQNRRPNNACYGKMGNWENGKMGNWKMSKWESQTGRANYAHLSLWGPNFTPGKFRLFLALFIFVYI